MALNFNNLIDINLKLLAQEGSDIRILEFKDELNKDLTEEQCRALHSRLQEESLIEEDPRYGKIFLSVRGHEISNFGGWNKHLEKEEKERIIQDTKNKATESLELEIKTLTAENLKLQNQQIKRYIMYSILGWISGIISSILVARFLL